MKISNVNYLFNNLYLYNNWYIINNELTKNPIIFKTKFSGIPAYTSVIIVVLGLWIGIHKSGDGGL